MPSASSRSEAASLEAAVDAFLAGADLSPSSTRVYRQALDQLGRELDCPVSLETIDAEHLEHAAARAWGHLGPTTWNRNLAALRSFLRWYSRDDELPARLMRHLRRRREPADRTRAISYSVLERLFRRESVPLREKVLWRLLYETAARAGEILALDVEDLDVPNHRARIRSKGGDRELVFFQTGSARLLPRLLAGRTRGPVFLTDRAAPPGTPTVDVCPVTGHARLSYRRAAALFAQHTRQAVEQGPRRGPGHHAAARSPVPFQA
jgi:integrase